MGLKKISALSAPCAIVVKAAFPYSHFNFFEKNIMQNTFKILLLAALAALCFGSCKPLEMSKADQLLPLPDTFIGAGADTVNAVASSWRQYFSDAHLVSLIDTALSNNLDLKMAMQRIEMAKAGVLASRGALLPSVDVGTSAGLSKFGRYTMDGAGNRGAKLIGDKDIPLHLPDFFIGFQSNWEIDAWGKLRNQRKAATARYLASVEGQRLVTTGLISEIVSIYYALVSLHTGLKIIDGNIDIQRNALEMVRVQKEAGRANELAVQQFEAQLLNLQGMRIDAEQQIIENENLLNFLLGRYPQTIAISEEDLLQLEAMTPAPGAPAQLLRNRPDIRAAEYEVLASKADLNAARALFYPNIEINALLGLQAFRPDLLVTSPASLTYGLLGSLAAPLVNRRAIQAEFKAANAYQLEALYAYQQAIIGAYVEVHNGIAGIRHLQQILELKQTEADVLTRSISTSDDLFRTNRATYIEVLLAQQNALNARLELVEVKKRQLLAGVELYRALGGG